MTNGENPTERWEVEVMVNPDEPPLSGIALVEWVPASESSRSYQIRF